jgi:hypothetical protein
MEFVLQRRRRRGLEALYATGLGVEHQAKVLNPIAKFVSLLVSLPDDFQCGGILCL